MMDDLDTQARAAFAQEDFAGAEALFRRLCAAAPDDVLALYNLGVTLGKLDRIEEALACYRRALEINPHFADAHINFAACLNEFNLVAQARRGFALARQIEPDNPMPVLNEGIAALALGDYDKGWEDFNARWRLPSYGKFKRAFPQPYWHGEDLTGKTLFLFAEQGFGDTIQMARYVPLLTARGAKIVIESPPALTRLLHSLHGNPHIITKGDAVPAFDFYCSMLDVPRCFGTRLDTIPAQPSYLFAPQEVSPWPARGVKQRIGLSWAGRASHANDHNRSLPFEQLAPLLEHDNVEWVSLQRIVSDHDTPKLAASVVQNWGKDFDDFAAAAQAMQNMDLVITVDTALAHLAGALGKPVWVLLPFYADWRWLMEREDSPWYPTARLFRQPRRKDWATVIRRVETALFS